MIRNMDLIRAMVLAIRNHEGKPSAAEVQDIIGNQDNGIYGYHIVLLIQSAMVAGVETGPRKDRFGWSSLALTWSGQEFADNILNEGVWEHARNTLGIAALESASFEIWSHVVIGRIKEMCEVVASEQS